MARTAALLPCSPADLLDLDLPLFNELTRQVVKREQDWSRRDEMAAQTIEGLYMLQKTLIAVNATKKVNVPDFVYPRPGGGGGDGVRVASHREMAALAGGRR